MLHAETITIMYPDQLLEIVHTFAFHLHSYECRTLTLSMLKDESIDINTLINRLNAENMLSYANAREKSKMLNVKHLR